MTLTPWLSIYLPHVRNSPIALYFLPLFLLGVNDLGCFVDALVEKELLMWVCFVYVVVEKELPPSQDTAFKSQPSQASLLPFFASFIRSIYWFQTNHMLSNSLLCLLSLPLLF